MSAALAGPPANILPPGGGQPVLHVNLEQNVIYIGEAQVRLCLNDHINRVRVSSEWQTPLAILLAVVLSLATSTFHDFVFPAATWQAIFVIVGGVSLIWLIRSLIRMARVRTSIDDIVAHMKRESCAAVRGPVGPQEGGGAVGA